MCVCLSHFQGIHHLKFADYGLPIRRSLVSVTVSARFLLKYEGW